MYFNYFTSLSKLPLTTILSPQLKIIFPSYTLISTNAFPHLVAAAWSVRVLLSLCCGAPPG